MARDRRSRQSARKSEERQYRKAVKTKDPHLGSCDDGNQPGSPGQRRLDGFVILPSYISFAKALADLLPGSLQQSLEERKLIAMLAAGCAANRHVQLGGGDAVLVVGIEHYSEAYDLLARLSGQGNGACLDLAMRRVVYVVRGINAQTSRPASIAEVASRLGITYEEAMAILFLGLHAEYLYDANDDPSQLMAVVAGVRTPEDMVPLPSPEKLQKAMNNDTAMNRSVGMGREWH